MIYHIKNEDTNETKYFKVIKDDHNEPLWVTVDDYSPEERKHDEEVAKLTLKEAREEYKDFGYIPF